MFTTENRPLTPTLTKQIRGRDGFFPFLAPTGGYDPVEPYTIPSEKIKHDLTYAFNF